MPTPRTPLALLALLCLIPSTARAQIVERLDVSTAGTFGDVAADRVVVSDDGRFVAFLSRASNLVLPDDAVSRDVFLRDRATATTTRLAVNVAQPIFLEISGDGRFVAWAVAVPPPVGVHQTFVHDRMITSTTQVGTQLADCIPGAMTADGQFMVVFGRASTMIGVPFEAFRLELQTGALVLASRDTLGQPAGAEVERGGISADGDVVAFSSAASNLVAGDTNGAKDVFLFRVGSGAIERVSVDDLGVQGDQDSIRPSLSADGMFVAFQSLATMFDPADGNGLFDVYLRDLAQSTTRRLTFTPAGTDLNGDSTSPLISADGRKVAFDSKASNLIAGDTSTSDIFVRDLGSELTRAVTPGSAIVGQECTLGSISADGRWVALRSTILSLPDAGTTGGAYLADFGPGCSASGYCTALANSTGEVASIGTQGDASFLLNNFTLSALNLPPNAIAIFASGTVSVDPAVPFGNGLRCIGGTLTRHGILHASNGVVIDHQDLTHPTYAGIQPGDVRFYQCIYRDPAAGGAAFNTTDAVAVTFCF